MQRKLTAILSADVKGYSRLMSEDEEGTIRTLTAYRGAMAGLIQQYRGRVVDAPGDNLLAEFASVVDAVNCAVEVQRELAERNAELRPERKMEFRIGVNLGDVVVEGERIYGDGVNIAARVESLAEGGGICISGTTYDQVENKLPLQYEYLGEQAVKNIPKPVRVYRVLSVPGAAAHRVLEARRAVARKWRKGALAVTAVVVLGVGVAALWNFYLRPSPPSDIASEEKMAFPLPEKPSIAVLPFDNLSGDPEQEYFSDGITEDIITTLSKISNLFVIARNSTFTYKGKPVKVQQVSEELGVRYVLEGSVQKAGDRVRITAQLVDATTGHHLWAERYDRDLIDLFALQDEITLRVATALHVKLTSGEQARVWRRGTDNLEAWDYYGRGREFFLRFTKEDNARAREMLEKALESDPQFAQAWVQLAWTHWQDARLGWSESRAESLKRAAELAEKALVLDASLADIYRLLAGIHLLRREHEKAIALGDKAVALNRNHAGNVASLARILIYSGRPEDAIGLIKKAMRLSPNYPAWYLYVLAEAYRLTGRYEEMIPVSKETIERTPWLIDSRMQLVFAYMELGREEEARAQVAEILKLHPQYSVEGAKPGWAKAWSFKDPAEVDRLFEALRKAGLPE